MIRINDLLLDHVGDRLQRLETEVQDLESSGDDDEAAAALRALLDGRQAEQRACEKHAA
jgi:hypothetical protein